MRLESEKVLAMMRTIVKRESTYRSRLSATELASRAAKQTPELIHLALEIGGREARKSMSREARLCSMSWGLWEEDTTPVCVE